MVIQHQYELGEGSAMPTDPHRIPTILQPSSSQPQKIQKPRKPKRKETWVPQPSVPIDNVADKAVRNKLGDSLVRAATTASSLGAEQDSGNSNKTRSKETPNESSSQGTNSCGGPRCQETIEDTTAQTRMVKKLEKKNRSRTQKLKRLYKVGLSARVESYRDEESLGEDVSKHKRRIDAIDVDDNITLVNDVDNEMFDVNMQGGKEMFVAGQDENVVEEVVDAAKVSTAATTITTEEITLAQALEALKTSKPKDKGKGIMIEELMKLKKKERAEKEQEANIALTVTWADIQAKIDDDHQLAERLQAQEQKELSDAQKATLFQKLLEKRRKYFAAKRVEEKRNKPPKQAQKRKIMCTYVKSMEGCKLKDLKLKTFGSIQDTFDRAFKRVNTFEDYKTEFVEGKEKRVREELEQEITKKQKVEDEREEAE
nr:hypothetical protein [Tanacetum cinerariifolium]